MNCEMNWVKADGGLAPPHCQPSQALGLKCKMKFDGKVFGSEMNWVEADGAPLSLSAESSTGNHCCYTDKLYGPEKKFFG